MGKKYRCIVADPPWKIDPSPPIPRASEGFVDPRKRSSNGIYKRSSTNRKPEHKYPMMSVAEIANLPVSSFAEDGCHLYLWTINRYIESAYSIARSWGFNPSQILVWAKKPKGILFGTFTSTTEFVLFCRRGTLKSLRRIDTTWWQWPRSNTHSKKPDELQSMIETVSPGPYLELFARRKRDGWDAWGNEVECDIDLSPESEFDPEIFSI